MDAESQTTLLEGQFTAMVQRQEHVVLAESKHGHIALAGQSSTEEADRNISCDPGRPLWPSSSISLTIFRDQRLYSPRGYESETSLHKGQDCRQRLFHDTVHFRVGDDQLALNLSGKDSEGMSRFRRTLHGSSSSEAPSHFAEGASHPRGLALPVHQPAGDTPAHNGVLMITR